MRLILICLLFSSCKLLWSNLNVVDVDNRRVYPNATINNSGPSDIDRAIDRGWDNYYENLNRIQPDYSTPAYTPSDYSTIDWGL